MPKKTKWKANSNWHYYHPVALLRKRKRRRKKKKTMLDPLARAE